MRIENPQGIRTSTLTVDGETVGQAIRRHKANTPERMKRSAVICISRFESGTVRVNKAYDY